MATPKTCPVCERLPGYREPSNVTCRAWYYASIGTGGDWSSIRECYAHGLDRRKEIDRLRDEVADLRGQLKAARSALSRHHAAENSRPAQEQAIDMFRDDARIE